jgi:hypothetical protein
VSEEQRKDTPNDAKLGFLQTPFSLPMIKINSFILFSNSNPCPKWAVAAFTSSVGAKAQGGMTTYQSFRWIFCLVPLAWAE